MAFKKKETVNFDKKKVIRTQNHRPSFNSAISKVEK